MKTLIVVLMIALVSCTNSYDMRGNFEVCYETREGKLCDTTTSIQQYTSSAGLKYVYHTKYNELRHVYMDLATIKEIR